jgi:L-phenylalanine/L-methionine N-acetyltransferase
MTSCGRRTADAIRVDVGGQALEENRMGVPDHDEDESLGREPPPGLIIRARRPSDAEKIAELVNLPGYRFGTNRIPYHSPEEVRGWIEKAPLGNLGLVAVVDDQIVGDGGLHRRSGRQLHVAEIGLGVHDAWTGKGVGTALLAALVEAADRWLGIWRLQLVVHVDNAPAIRLYRRFGFEMEGTTAPLRCGTANTSTPTRWRASALRASPPRTEPRTDSKQIQSPHRRG